MMDGFEYKGIWWLPLKPEKKVYGTLKYNKIEGTTLELEGSFSGYFTGLAGIMETQEHEIILGSSSDGKSITLYNCFEKQSSYRLSGKGYSTSSYYANNLFIGAHYEQSEDIKFKSVSIHYSNLDEWAHHHPRFDIQESASKEEIVIKHKGPEPITANLKDGIKIHLVVHREGPILSFVQKEVIIRQKTYLKIEASEEKSFEDFFKKKIFQLRNFITLGVHDLVQPLIIVGTTETNKEIIDGREYSPPVQIYKRLLHSSSVFKTIHPFNMLFTFKDISNSFETILEKWFKSIASLETVYNSYFSMIYNPDMYLQDEFITLMQSLEAYHRKEYGGDEGIYMSEDEYQLVYDSMIKAIPEQVDSSLKVRLKNALKFGNQHSQRKRVKFVINKYKDITDKFLGNGEAFGDTSVDTRNYLIHHDKSPENVIFSGDDFIHATQKLKILLEICLLSDLGFSNETIATFLSRIREYREYFNPRRRQA